MDYYFFKSGLIFFVNVCLLSAVAGQDQCIKKGPCICAFPNGTGIDLSPISKTNFSVAQIYVEKKEGIELHTYYYHPCYDVIPPPPMNVESGNNTCNKNLTICRHIYTLTPNINNGTTYIKDPGFYNFLGDTAHSNFSINGDAIIYDLGPSKNTVLLVCAETDDELHVNSASEPNDIVLALYSRAACRKPLNLPSEAGRSLGSTLVIVFFSCAIFYLVLGICTKKFLMGATGIEVIPNLAFWSDLPNLVKDGWAFLLAGFKLPVRGSGPGMTPDPNSYDSI